MPIRTSVIIVVAVLASGCGGSSPTPRAEVAGYLTKANAIERQLQAPLQVVDQTVNGGSALPQSGGGSAVARGREQSLLDAWRKITALRASLAGVKAPAAAAQLRELLLRLADRQAALTLQSARLVRFLPAFTAALKPLGPATARLTAVLRINQGSGATAVAALYAQKAQALRLFRLTTQQTDSQLLRLTPPTILLPSYRTELTALRGMGSAAAQLAEALTAGQTTKIAPLLSAFNGAAAAPGARPAQVAQAAAIRSYDRQVAQLTELQLAAARERLRLASTLR